MKYMTIVLKLADNADGELVIKAAENIHGSTLSAIAWAHALDERDDLSAEITALRRQLSEAHMAAGRASVIAYKEGKNGIERHPGNTANENAAWEWGRKDGGWDGKH